MLRPTAAKLYETGAVTRDNERALVAALADSVPVNLPRVAAADSGRLWAAAPTANGIAWSDAPGPNRSRGRIVTWRGSRTLRTRFARDGSLAAVFDERGRLALLEPRTGRVMLRLS